MRYLLDQWPDFKIILQKVFLGDPLPKVQKWFVALNKMAARAKNRRNSFK